MAEDRQQASITIKGTLDASLDKAFDNAYKKIDKLDKKLNSLGGASKRNDSISQKAAASQEKYNRSLKKGSGIAAKAGGSFGGLTSSLMGAAAAYISVSAAAGAAMSVIRTSARFTGRIGELKAVTNGEASLQQVEQMREQAKLLGRTTLFDADEVAQGMVALGKAGLKTQQIMASIPDTLNLAQAGGIGLGQAAEVMADAMAQFNLEAVESGRVADVFSKAANISTIEVSDLVESMKFLGPTVAQLGGSIEDASALVALLGLGGLKGGIGTRAFASSLQRLAKRDLTDDQAAGLKAAGLDVFKGGKFVGIERMFGDLAKGLEDKSDQDKLGIVGQIFGTESAKSINAILGQGTAKLREFVLELQNSTGSAKEFGEIKADNLEGDLRLLGSAFKGLQIELGDAFGPQLRGTVQDLTQGLNDLSLIINTNIDTMQRFGKNIGYIFDPFGSQEEDDPSIARRKAKQRFTQESVNRNQFLATKAVNNGTGTFTNFQSVNDRNTSVSIPVNLNIAADAAPGSIKTAVIEAMQEATSNMERVLKDSTSFTTVRGGL